VEDIALVAPHFTLYAALFLSIETGCIFKLMRIVMMHRYAFLPLMAAYEENGPAGQPTSSSQYTDGLASRCDTI
jgi:hypothetical protein